MSRVPEVATSPPDNIRHRPLENLKITQTVIEDPAVIDNILTQLAKTVGLDKAKVAHIVVYQSNNGHQEIFCITTDYRLQVFSHNAGNWSLGWHNADASRLLYNISIMYPGELNSNYSQYYSVCALRVTELSETAQAKRLAYIIAFLQKVFPALPQEVISATATNVQQVVGEHTRVHDYRTRTFKYAE